MKTNILSILTSAALLGSATAATAAAKTAQSDEVKAVQANGGSGEKKICKRLEASGTRFSERACLTKQEWRKLESLN